jgi:hypothetical protein
MYVVAKQTNKHTHKHTILGARRRYFTTVKVANITQIRECGAAVKVTSMGETGLGYAQTSNFAFF